jgi:hypothetical protein
LGAGQDRAGRAAPPHGDEQAFRTTGHELLEPVGPESREEHLHPLALGDVVGSRHELISSSVLRHRVLIMM